MESGCNNRYWIWWQTHNGMTSRRIESFSLENARNIVNASKCQSIQYQITLVGKPNPFEIEAGDRSQ